LSPNPPSITTDPRIADDDFTLKTERGVTLTSYLAQNIGQVQWEVTPAVNVSMHREGDTLTKRALRGRRYIDGGMRSATNADVAKGYDAVLVIAVTYE
jgi:hypothetical protein